MVIIIKSRYFAYFVASSLLLKIFVGNEQKGDIVKKKILVATANLFWL